jgi:acyl-CoA reductase-like NAD-dependent aldehyde dehydrogenase
VSKNQLYINGEWTDSTGNETADVINPATEEVIDTVPVGTEEDVDKAVAAAKEAFKTWNKTSIEERIEYMEKVYDEIEKHQQEIADTIVAELGTSQTFAENNQAPQPLNEMRATLDEIKDYEFEYYEYSAKIIKEGYGVVACITPWNYPINQIQRKITPAILGGNTVVVKPPTNTPLTAILYAKLIDNAGLPKGVFNLVTGSGSTTGDYLSKHEDVDVISFTGSTEVGKQMYANASDHIKQVVLELGGKSPLVYLKGGDLKAAVKQSMDTVLNNQGQTCTALTRLLVPEDELEDAKQAVLDYYEEAVVIGDPTDKETMVGPMVSEDQQQTVLDYIETGKQEGAEILVGGGKIDGPGYYVEPTVFIADNDMTISQEEIFGPVLNIITYKDKEEAIELANDVVYGLSGAVVGPQEEAEEVAAQLRTGNIIVNGGDRIAKAPFGGYKQSGRGRENGIYGVEDYLEIKSLFL